MKKKWIGIAKLQEEMGELQCILGKLQAYPNGGHPDESYSQPLLERLWKELADVNAAVMFFQHKNFEGVEALSMVKRSLAKQELYEKWDKEEGMTGVYVTDE